MTPQTSYIRSDFSQSVTDFLTQCNHYLERKEYYKALSILSRLSLFQFQNNQNQDAIDTSKRAQDLAIEQNLLKEASFLSLQEADFHIGLYSYSYSIGKYIDAIALAKKITDSESEIRIVHRFFDLYSKHSSLHGVLCNSYKSVVFSSYVSQANFFEIFCQLLLFIAKKTSKAGLHKYSTELYDLLPKILQHCSSLVMQVSSRNSGNTLSNTDELNDLQEKLDSLNFEILQIRETLEVKNSYIRASIHDLTNPLQNIRMFSELMQQMLSDFDNPDIVELTDALKKSTKEVLHIVSQMGLFNIVERNSYESSFIEVKLPLLLQNEVNKLKDLMSSKNISFRFMQETPNISIRTKPKSVGYIFSELLVNAIKFSPPNSIVAVNIQSKQVQKNLLLLRISVRDQGPGIKLEELNKIGIPFTKLSSKPTNNEPSAGLGLAIATMLSNQITGRIHIDQRQTIGLTIHFDITVEQITT